jgi:hypothetical protein
MTLVHEGFDLNWATALDTSAEGFDIAKPKTKANIVQVLRQE